MANILSGCRMAGSLSLVFFSAFSVPFYLLYLFCGVTDIIDGFVARKTNTASRFGARLDTAADLLFAGAALWKLLPALPVPGWLWGWIALIACIKMMNIIGGLLCQKRLAAEHTVMNKVTGLLLFLLPLTLPWMELTYSAAAVCLIATFAAIQEGYYIRAGREIT